MRTIIHKNLMLGGIAVAALCLLVPADSRADFAWFNTDTNRITYAGGSTPVTADHTDPSIGVFVQLIHAPSGVIHPAINVGSGVTGDNVVVSNVWMGINIPGFISDIDGWMNSPGTFSDDVPSDDYFVRVWSAPSPDFSQGLVPTSLTNRYGNSALWPNPGTVPPGPPDEFNFGGTGFSTTLQAIPEPGMVGLLFVGLLALRMAHRNRAKTA